MLDRLAVLGMRLAEEVVERAVDSPYHPEMKHEPARAFAQVSRTVRFTLVLQERAQNQIIALRKGELAPSLIPERTARPESQSRPVRRDEWAEDSDPEDGETARNESGRSRENLTERETYDEVLGRPFNECVETIRADLGVDPDPDQTVEEIDFSPPQAASNTTLPNPPVAANADTQIIGSGLAGGP